MMFLDDLLKQITMERDLEKCTVSQYARAINKLSLHLGKTPDIVTGKQIGRAHV